MEGGWDEGNGADLRIGTSRIDEVKAFLLE